MVGAAEGRCEVEPRFIAAVRSTERSEPLNSPTALPPCPPSKKGGACGGRRTRPKNKKYFAKTAKPLQVSRGVSPDYFPTFAANMIKTVEITVLPSELGDEHLVRERAALAARVPLAALSDCRVVRRSLDARGKGQRFLLRVEVSTEGDFVPEAAILAELKPCDASRFSAIIVGAGPAGYFAAIELLALGIKPIVMDRGKDVRARRRDLRAIQVFGQVDANSNYCFGEGGAGTYSDGKLYTRSQKRGNIERALRLFVEHGATSDILLDAHPHIGSNKLPNVVANMRETIVKYGGEVHFETLVTDVMLHEGRMCGVFSERISDGKTQEWRADAVVLATGHSARDIYSMLHQRGILIEAKPFALGVRIEHPQQLIDNIQYGRPEREANLPASSYSLVCQIKGNGVFSFCMCPGGLVVPAATAAGEIVVNGMSMSRRDSEFANAGTVVAIEPSRLDKKYVSQGVFSALAFQRDAEQTMFNFGDGSQKAPAQRLTDFVSGKLSSSLPSSSYIPGLVSAPVHALLPPFVAEQLRAGVQQFGKMMRGYFTESANVIGIESRTSAPIKIPRDRTTYQHPEVVGFFPCGEGAGYAGGIISAALDGQNVARAIARFVNS